ncbi:MAG: hypothetical protein ABF979_06880 [Gluconobacter sp.]|uniref:hypothetical protein n=1 Tax=Gluconobacter sp. TaxID=1876758 RepID=UPI0039EBBB58
MGVRRSPPPALPFDTLPESSSPSSQGRRVKKTPDISQPDLLEWQPPVTHLTAEDVGAIMLEAVAFRPLAGETFLYALMDFAQGQAIFKDGLSLADRLVFLEGPQAVLALADIPPEQEIGILRVRRRLIQSWLEVAQQGHGPCYVLVAKDPSHS